MQKLLFPSILVGIVVILGAIFVLGGGPQQSAEEDRLGTRHEIAEDLTHVPDGTRVEYATEPPTSGPHYGVPLEAGMNEGEIADEQVVHNLEHGYIWISYRRCDDQRSDNCLDEDQVRELKFAANDLPGDPVFNKQKFVMAPRSRNERAIWLSAWGYSHALDEVDADTIRRFYDDHVNRGPEIVP